MKKTLSKEVTVCDQCNKEAYVETCLKCGAEFCYDCRKTCGVEYPHGVYFSGSGDGFYCNKCDSELKATGVDPLHSAYLKVKYLRDENTSFARNFKARTNDAEAEIKRLVP